MMKRGQTIKLILITVMILGDGSLGAAKMPDPIYLKQKYPKDHWAVKPFTLDQDQVVAKFTFKKQYHYVLIFHPRDARGYRSIVRFTGNDLEKSMNRPFTADETLGLAIITHMVSRAYERIVPVAQTFKLGNNSQSMDPKTKIIYFGNEKEPFILHSHIMGRGNPDQEYVPGVPLLGPTIGKFFLFEFVNKKDLGNDQVIPWKKGQMKKVKQRLQKELFWIKQKDMKGYEIETQTFQHPVAS